MRQLDDLIEVRGNLQNELKKISEKVRSISCDSVGYQLIHFHLFRTTLHRSFLELTNHKKQFSLVS